MVEGNSKAYYSFVLKMCHPSKREQLLFNELRYQYQLKVNGEAFVRQLDHIIQKVHALTGYTTYTHPTALHN